MPCSILQNLITSFSSEEAAVAGKGQARVALIPHAHVFLCGLGGGVCVCVWYKVVAITQNGAAELPGTKGVRSVNVKCSVILTGPQQGRPGVIIILI